MRKGMNASGATRYARAVVICALAACGCAGRRPPPGTPVQGIELLPEERLGIDDVFEVRVFAEPDLSGTYRISADGTVDYPFVGRSAIRALRSALCAGCRRLRGPAADARHPGARGRDGA